MKLVSLTIFTLLIGLALGSTSFVWHVWSDNAYLYTYLLGMALLISGVASAALVLSKRVGWTKALGGLVLAGIISFILLVSLGLTNPLANQILAVGNGNQSPCLAEVRKDLSRPVLKEPSGFHQPSSEELRLGEQASLNGSLAQILIPFLTGSMLLGIGLFRQTRRVGVARGATSAVLVAFYIYARGPGAWCGQVFGLDTLLVITVGLLWVLAVFKFPKR